MTSLEQVARLVLAHERELREIRQSTDLDFVLVDAAAKGAVLKALAEAEPGPGQRVAALRAVVAVLAETDTAGSGRLGDASDRDLLDLALRFKAKHREPLAERPWKFTLALGLAARPSLREAVSDLAASGGNAKCLVRRPLLWMGRMAEEIQAAVEPDRKGKGKGPGKGQGKGLAKGPKGKKGPDAGTGRGGGGGRGGPPALAPAGDEPSASADGSRPPVPYSGEPALKKPRSPTPGRK
jgi:hypothetical protein